MEQKQIYTNEELAREAELQRQRDYLNPLRKAPTPTAMTSHSPTPETDEVDADYNYDRIRQHARTLERERNALKAECEALRSALQDAMDALYNPFEPDNQSRAYKDALAALRKTLSQPR